ncbi:hypothetical protein K458DRAFT_320815, partial [Lentithecium fluviatile CBS 122367]
FDDALAPLLSRSLVRTEIGEQALEMHRLVQLSMRTWLAAKKGRGRWVKESVRALCAAFPSGDYKTWEECKVLLPHVKEIVSLNTDDEEDLVNQAKSALRAGWYLLLRGEYRAAEGFFRMSTDTREKMLGREHPDTLTSVYHLAFLFHQQQHYPAACALYQRACDGCVKVLGTQHPITLACLDHYKSARKH